MESPVALRGGLTLEQLGFYFVNGYLVVDDFLTPEQCDNFVARAEKIAEPPEYPMLMNPDRDIPEFRELMRGERIVQMLETIQGRMLVGLMSQMSFKKPETGYGRQAWAGHQDNSFPKFPPGDYITTNIFFSESDPENGGLIMYPGSHRKGLYASMPAMSFREQVGQRPGNRVVNMPERFQPIDLITKKGSVLFLAGEVVHESYPNTSKTRARPLFQGTYGPFGSPFWPGLNSQKKPILLHTREDYFEDEKFHQF